MNNVRFFFFLIWMSMAYAMPARTTGPRAPIPADSIVFKSGYVSVNGIRLFYQEAGEGDPILFLHGGFGTSEGQFAAQFEHFFQTHRLITFDTRGHRRSEFDEKAFSYELFAADTYQFLEALGIDRVSIIGFSDGGITGAILAGQHPEMVKHLVVIGANSVADTTAFFPADIAWVQNMNIQEMAEQIGSDWPEYPADKRVEFVKGMQKLWLEEPNLSEADLNRISCPVLIVAGDSDSIKMEHQVYLYRHIPGSRLLILPNTGHDAHISRAGIVNPLIQELMEGS